MSEQSLVATLLSSEVRFPWRTNHEIAHLTEVRVTTNRVDIVYFEKKSELEIIKKLGKKVSEAVESIFIEGKDKAMSLYN